MLPETLHVLGLAHTETTSAYATCAYTQNVIKFCKMMRAEGARVVLYGAQENEADVDEHVPIVSRKEQREWFGPYDPNDWTYSGMSWSPDAPYWRTMNARAIEAIGERLEHGDIVCVTAGQAQEPVMRALQDRAIAVEWTVGYKGICQPSQRVFPSSAWRHHIYGLRGIETANAFDEVIPHFFEAEDKGLSVPGKSLLFVGRLMEGKGPHVAAAIADRLGAKLLVAGPGVQTVERGRIVCADGTVIRGDVEYLGVLTQSERDRAMGEALAVLVPTQYLEPFGCVAVEAMLAGAPVVATDWGAFPEIVEEGITGARFSTLDEGARAIDRTRGLKREAVRKRARERFSFRAIGPRYRDYFARVNTLWTKGWFQ
jgi:glycosyltransferase involved in cell wall biosynthesis